MFFNNKPHQEAQGLMFDQQRIGANIMKARKAKGYTQMTLADALGVSFQAVSNWERGQTCPDIANLSELSRVLNLSIDELLGNRRAAEITREIAEDKTPELQPEELQQVAPLLTGEQADKAAGVSASDFAALAALAPFLSEEFLGEAVITLYERTGSLDGAMSLAPFMAEDDIGELASLIVPQEGVAGLTKLAPFMNEDELGDFVLEQFQKGGLKDINSLLPFLNDNVLCELAEQLLKKGDLKAILPLAPFLDEDILDEVARAILKGKDPSMLSGLAAFLTGDSGDC